jgi:dTDP-4-dehydrorhamnose 3,5-epimerase
LRPASATYKQWVGVELNEDDHRMLYVPKDFAHGFLTLRDESEVTYLVSQSYQPDYEAGLRWDDPAFGIEWPKDVALAEISDRDRTWPDYVEKSGSA